MTIQTVFLSINADDFEAQTEWWGRLIGRGFDRQPMPSCHEWELTPTVAFQVLDNPGKPRTDVALRFDVLAPVVARLRGVGVSLPEAQPVEGFAALMLVSLTDPEGNRVSLLEGA